MTPNRSAEPNVVETHISTLFFAGERVYKLAKRVALPFLDTTDADDRLRLAAREVELNRRYSPDVYLGYADVTEMDRVVDRMIVMRRLPPDRALTRLLNAGDATRYLTAVARRIAAIHASAEALSEHATSSERLVQNWSDNFGAIEPHVGSVIEESEFDAVRLLAEGYLAHSRQLPDSRISGGFVRDGHGDLTADDIYCLDDGPRILDCLAFDDDLRIDDVLNDIAFLAMDVHRLSGHHAAQTVMTAYHEFSNEQHPPSLAHHYVAYRAHVRAKIACLRVAQGDRASADLVRTYHSLALHHLERAKLRVVLVGGGPGAGKTMLSSGIADHFGYVHLATDEIRHDVAKVPHTEHAFTAIDQGAYEPAQTDATYAEQRREARSLLTHGYGVVLDASWTSADQRAAIRQEASEAGVEVVEIECVLDDAIARDRIVRRLATSNDPSDATPELVDVMKARRDAWPEAHQVSTAPSADEVLESAVVLMDAPR